MRVLAFVVALLLAAPVYAKPANTECVADDGSRFYMLASNGTVVIKWGRGDWQNAFAEVEGVMVTVTQIAPNGVIIVAWNTNTNAAYVLMKDDRNGKKTGFHARCWFK